MDEVSNIVTPVLVIKSSDILRIRPEYHGLESLDKNIDYKFILSSFLVGDIYSAVFLLRHNNGLVYEDSKMFSFQEGENLRQFFKNCLNFFMPGELDILKFDQVPMEQEKMYELISTWSGGSPI